MAKKVIKIDSYIGSWGYSKQLLKLDLKGTETDGAVIEISSLGGSVDHAIDMYNQIAKHGNVEVVYTGPSASAATFLGMGAKKVSIFETGFILIHKVMAVVDNYGAFNEDELERLIEELQTTRIENQKFDLAIARIYNKRSGKSIEDTIALMKKNIWLTAEEALENGLVDDIIEPTMKYNRMDDRLVAMVSSCELPPLPASVQKPKKQNMEQFARINQVLGVDELVIEDGGSWLNRDQLNMFEERLNEAATLETNYTNAISERDNLRLETVSLNQQIEALTTERDTLSASVTGITSERDSAIAERDAAASERNTLSTENERMAQERDAMISDIDSLHDTIAGAENFDKKMAAIRQILARIPGGLAQRTLDKSDKDFKPGDVDWNTINSLPHNRDVDKNM